MKDPRKLVFSLCKNYGERAVAGDKVKVEFEINTDAKDFLEGVKSDYRHPSISKTLRCLIDFAQSDGDLDEIFKKVRCNRCG